ncbi:hypothetical protein BJ138DRAFT_1087080 [Hygrophoropsis aurantiaca]|uniref:Uncharacterized protein n=1 Tax=Hygrophoropsis aurantiaca TaxID=72124 RepID=A0ACB8ACD5_9AGAM|nr:hypothetical protein BJ138DRAFT_1087080 [Hygrophoropsis aurantiaca]
MQSTDCLPSFLQPLPDFNPSLPGSYINSFYPATELLGPVHVHWWPCRQRKLSPTRVLVFIPGNPGLIEFYPPFLSAIHDKDESGRLAILSHSHLNHAPTLALPKYVPSTGVSSALCGLAFQVQNALRIYDAVRSTFDSDIKIILAGHSVGSWIALQVLKARPNPVSGIFLLFPTITDIAKTPNGRKLSWAFSSPIPRIASGLSRVLWALPFQLLRRLFPAYPLEQVRVLQSLLRSPTAIYAALTMAHDEMEHIQQLDQSMLDLYRHQICLYFAETDDWVGEQKEVILNAFKADPGAVRVVHGHRNIPHAFCINHGEELAAQCHEWLSSGDFS